MLTTTLNHIRERSPYHKSLTKLLAGLGKREPDDEPLPYARIAEIEEVFGSALFLCRAEPQHAKEWRLFGVWCARQAQHLLKDQRSLDALDVVERYANGLATDEEFDAAENAAGAAARDTALDAARAAGASVASVQDAAFTRAALAAAWAAAWDAGDYRVAKYPVSRDAFLAAWNSALAARAVWNVANRDAWNAALDASWNAWLALDSSAEVRAAQKAKFLEIVSC